MAASQAPFGLQVALALVTKDHSRIVCGNQRCQLSFNSATFLTYQPDAT
jgi:hypothetical protein